MNGKNVYCRYVKRILDIALSATLLVLLVLPMLVIAVAIRADSCGGAIFRQKRVGRGGRVFICYKFRTMYVDAPHNKKAAEMKNGDAYVTRVGRALRRTSLDELPQLFNVLRGNMSLIGPRPLICEEREIHEGRMSLGVYCLRPGITGMSQVTGRNSLEDGEKLKGDVYYLKHVGLMLDLRILFSTLLKVISGEGLRPSEEKNAEGERVGDKGALF